MEYLLYILSIYKMYEISLKNNTCVLMLMWNVKLSDLRIKDFFYTHMKFFGPVM